MEIYDVISQIILNGYMLYGQSKNEHDDIEIFINWIKLSIYECVHQVYIFMNKF